MSDHAGGVLFFARPRDDTPPSPLFHAPQPSSPSAPSRARTSFANSHTAGSSSASGSLSSPPLPTRSVLAPKLGLASLLLNTSLTFLLSPSSFPSFLSYRPSALASPSSTLTMPACPSPSSSTLIRPTSTPAAFSTPRSSPTPRPRSTTSRASTPPPSSMPSSAQLITRWKGG